MSTPSDEELIRYTNDLALQARQRGADPFAAILVKEQQIVKQVSDRSLEYSDPTYHAELSVISEYCRETRIITLDGYSIYCSTEPCPMCSGAIHWARISRVVFSVSQKMLRDLTGSKDNQPDSRIIINYNNRSTEIVGPLLPQEGLAVFDGFEFSSKATRHEKWLKQSIFLDQQP